MKKYVLPVTIIIIGLLLSLAYSFHQGEEIFNFHCNQYLSGKTRIYTGFENCDKNAETFIRDPLDLLYITAFVAYLTIISRVSEFKQRFSVYSGSVLLFLLFMALSQILLNTFPHVSYDGWLDASWSISESTKLVSDFSQFGERPTALIFSGVISLLFPLIAFTGPLLASYILRNILLINPETKRIAYYLTFVFTSVILQAIIFLTTIPLTFMFAFGW
jgi:hypothetical protein